MPDRGGAVDVVGCVLERDARVLPGLEIVVDEHDGDDFFGEEVGCSVVEGHFLSFHGFARDGWTIHWWSWHRLLY